jgi:serine/threonine protein kinase
MTSSGSKRSPALGNVRSPQRAPFFGALDSSQSIATASPAATSVASSGSARNSLTPSGTCSAPKELQRAMQNTAVNAPALRFMRPQGVDQLMVTWEAYRGGATDGVTPRVSTQASADIVTPRYSGKLLRSPSELGVADGVVISYSLEMEEHSVSKRETKMLYEGDKTQFLVSGLAPGAAYSFRVKVQARAGPLPTARVLASVDDPWCSSRWSPSAMFVMPATAPASCRALHISAKGPGEVILVWEACGNNGAPIEAYLVQAAECPELPKPGDTAALSEVWRDVYSGGGEVLTCVVPSLSVGVCYKFRVRASNEMGAGPWSDDCVFTTRAVAPEAPPSSPQLLNCLATSVDLAWDVPEDNASGIYSYTVQMQIDTSSEQVGANPSPNMGAAESHMLLPPTPIGDSGNTRLFTVDASTRLCTVGDLTVGVRYLFRVRASNEAGPGAWSASVWYTPKPGPPLMRSAPELSSAEPGHVCVEWEAADCNGMDLLEYELEMAAPELTKGDAKSTDKFEAVEVYKIDCKLRVYHIKDLAHNKDKRYLFRLRAINGIGHSEWSDVASIDMIKRDEARNIDFAEIEMGEVIGEGGFSVVYRGIWNNRQVAVKRLKVQYAEGGEHHAEEFKREVELLSNLRHRNIVQYIGASLQSPDLCVLTELALYSLSDLLYKHNTRLKLEQTLGFAKDIAKGVKYLHALRPMIIHRDLKSSNLLIDDRNVLKISDFGLSRIKNESVTKISGMLGTPGWSAPEIYKQDKYTEKVDMYSYGVVLSEMVTGEKPYAGLNQMQIAFATVYQGQRPTLPDWIPKQLKGLIKGCWDSVPAKRPAWEKVLDSLSQMEDLAFEQRQARDGLWGGGTRPPRLRAGHNRRPPPTPDPLTTHDTAKMDMTKGCPTPTRSRAQNQSSGSVRRPGSVEVAIPSSADVGQRGMVYRANSPTRASGVRMGVNSAREPCKFPCWVVGVGCGCGADFPSWTRSILRPLSSSPPSLQTRALRTPPA